MTKERWEITTKPCDSVPTLPDAYDNRGSTRAKLGDDKGAIADYSQALRFNPNDADAYYNRGLARAHLEDKKESLADFQKAAEAVSATGENE